MRDELVERGERKKKYGRLDDENDGRICRAPVLIATEGSEGDVSKVKEKFLRDDWQYLKFRELLDELEAEEGERVLVGSVSRRVLSGLRELLTLGVM